jgi:hypothetical protein
MPDEEASEVKQVSGVKTVISREYAINLHRSDDLEAYYNAFRKHALARFRSIADRTTPALIGQTNFQTIFNTQMDEICAALTDVSNFDPKSDPELKAYGRGCARSSFPEGERRGR